MGTPISWTCGLGRSCCGVAPSGPASTVSGAGQGSGAPTPAGLGAGEDPSSLLPLLKLDGVLALVWALVLPSLQWGWAQRYVGPFSSGVSAPGFKSPDWGVGSRPVRQQIRLRQVRNGGGLSFCPLWAALLLLQAVWTPEGWPCPALGVPAGIPPDSLGWVTGVQGFSAPFSSACPRVSHVTSEPQFPEDSYYPTLQLSKL